MTNSDEFHFGTLQGTDAAGVAQFDKGSFQVVTFSVKPVLNEFRSNQEGRPVYDDREMVRVLTPGERDEVERYVEPSDRLRWPEQWRAFRENAEQGVSGTLLTHLFPGQPAVVEGLKAVRFHTVEQLAEASDQALSAIGMGGIDYREKAKRYLEVTGKGAGFAKIEKRLAEQDAAIQAQNDRMAQLEAENAALKAKADTAEDVAAPRTRRG